MPKTRAALHGRVIREGDEFNRIMPGKLTLQRDKGVAITDHAHPCPIGKQSSDQRQGALNMPKAHCADRTKNPSRPQARVMGLIGFSQTCLTCSGKA
jgi:hypothetical protein